jgi:hypothetical protein
VVAAVAVAGCSAAGGGPASAWRVVGQVGRGQNSDVTAAVLTGRSAAWAFSGNGIYAPAAFRRRGGTWRQVAFPAASGQAVVAAGAASPADVWAFTTGAQSLALHWDGTAWAAVHSFPLSVGGAVVAGPDDVWAFGEPGRSGRRWTTGTSTARLWIPMPDNSGGPGHLVHYSGGRLSAAALPVGAARIDVESVAWVPGTASVLAGGFTHVPGRLSRGDAGVILQLGG